MPSPAGWHEVPCIECGRFVEGIDFAERCAECLARRKRRAQRLATQVALVATALAAVWTVRVMPLTATSRWYAGAAIGGTYFLVRLIVRRIAMEVLP
jgi:predicted nucleic acid-binding Zn ribbon protein